MTLARILSLVLLLSATGGRRAWTSPGTLGVDAFARTGTEGCTLDSLMSEFAPATEVTDRSDPFVWADWLDEAELGVEDEVCDWVSRTKSALDMWNMVGGQNQGVQHMLMYEACVLSMWQSIVSVTGTHPSAHARPPATPAQHPTPTPDGLPARSLIGQRG